MKLKKGDIIVIDIGRIDQIQIAEVLEVSDENVHVKLLCPGNGKEVTTKRHLVKKATTQILLKHVGELRKLENVLLAAARHQLKNPPSKEK